MSFNPIIQSQIAYGSLDNTIESDSNLTWDNANKRLETNGFFKQGEHGTNTKKYFFSGTFPNTQGSSVGLVLPISIVSNKIVAMDVIGQWTSNAWMPRNFTLYGGYQFDIYTDNASPCNLYVILAASNSSSMVSQPFHGYVEYSE